MSEEATINPTPMRLRAEPPRLLAHRTHERRATARIVAREHVCGAVVRSHQRQLQELRARELRADRQPRRGLLRRLCVLGPDHEHFVERLVRRAHDERGHQLRDRRDRARRLVAAPVEDFVGPRVEHDDRARLQLRIVRRDPVRLRRRGCRRRDAHRREQREPSPTRPRAPVRAVSPSHCHRPVSRSNASSLLCTSFRPCGQRARSQYVELVM